MKREQLIALDSQFCDYLAESNAALYQQLLKFRADVPDVYTQAPFLIELAPYLEDFIGKLFDVTKFIKELQNKHHKLAPLYRVKRNFVQRIALRKYKDTSLEEFENSLQRIASKFETELAFAEAIEQWQVEDNQTILEIAGKICAYSSLHAISNEAEKSLGFTQDDSILFHHPEKLDPANLLDLEEVIIHGVRMYQSKHVHHRKGFSLTDKGVTLEEALDNANYCIYCHDRKKDSCSKGMRDKKSNTFQQNDQGINLNGCPLEERISEMNLLKKDGYTLGALAMIMIDNPLCAATGHRICNDCMKSCIYQKQQPVDIPKIESRTLQDILELPYGFEIYNLLAQWNPLNLIRPLPKPASGYTILVVGMGPAGFNLAYHLLQEGHAVVGIDGLKIEPLADNLASSPAEMAPDFLKDSGIKDIKTIWQDLDKRPTPGFGGVAEYGITVRWNKNNLTLIRMILERHARFKLFGGIRFGSGLDRQIALQMGFSHIALCMGAGRPTVINIPNKLARGVRQASDFLMSLQLTGAARLDSPANLQIRLPVAVIGGGLTAIDTATEALAYYVRQVEKFAALHKQANIASLNWNDEEQTIANEFLSHAQQLSVAQPSEIPDLLKKWGGVTVVYRKTLQEAPCYRLNHEEVELAMQEGIHFAENLSPTSVDVDAHGAASGLSVESPQGNFLLPAKTILVAAGTKPNTVLAREDIIFQLQNNYFKTIESDNIAPQYITQSDQVSVFTHKTDDQRYVSFFGDLHPNYAGNVVKAMASAKHGYPKISEVLTKAEPVRRPEDIFLQMQQDCTAKVHRVDRLAPGIVEILVHAPLAARTFQPGQFYRLQNFESNATSRRGMKLSMEGLAVTGASVDKENGLLSTIVLEMGGSSNLCAALQPGESIVLMGPTGTPTEIPKNKTVILCGGGLGNAVLFSIGKAMRQNGCKVIYFAGYKTAESRVKIAEIEAAADIIIWCCDEKQLSTTRKHDLSFQGNIIEAMQWYAQIPAIHFPLSNASHMVVIGSDRMMAAVATARHNQLKPYLDPNHMAVGSINSPMQCMMKEICAQCLQIHRDPVTGEETTVFSCFNQDQTLDNVCFKNLNDRLKQNNVQEKLLANVLSLA